MSEIWIQNLKRLLALVVGIGLLIASINFSNRGFDFNISDPNVGWIGWTMAISITAIELVFNGQLSYKQTNYTLYTLGVAAYLYGVFSNVIGVWSFQSITMATFSDITPASLFGLFLGLFLEIAPEPLIVFGLIGISDTEGDMIGALFNTFKDNDRPTKTYNKPQFSSNSVNKPDNKQRTKTELPPSMSFRPTKTPGEYVRENTGWEDSLEDLRRTMGN